jgi:hypothetical protein
MNVPTTDEYLVAIIRHRLDSSLLPSRQSGQWQQSEVRVSGRKFAERVFIDQGPDLRRSSDESGELETELLLQR